MSAVKDFQAVLFDFDGTLADSYGPIAASVNHVRSRYGLDALPVDEVKRYVGRGPHYLFSHTVPGGNTDRDLAVYRQHHPSVMIEGTRFYPGAVESLNALQAAGKAVGLCSNKPRMFSEKLLGSFGLADLFDVVLGPGDVAHPKPAPDMLLAALGRLKLKPADALYVGDMTIDIETARAAGLTVWVVPTGCDDRATLEAARPDRILESLVEFHHEAS